LQEGDAAKAADLLGGLSDSADKVNHAYALLGLGKAEGALREFDAVLTQEPIHDEAAFGRGLALVALGRRSEAATCFETLLARSPTHVSAPAARKQLARLRE
jgi:tetratricopeptide (TPR) repeat protein